MAAFVPKQRTEIYAEITAQVLAFAPLTSTELGEVIDNIAFGIADQTYEVYVEIVNALALLKLDTTTGSDLDQVGSEYPDLAPRFSAVTATGQVQVSDPGITKISSTVAIGGANDGDTFLNIVDASLFPINGVVLIGTRGQPEYETWPYTGKSGNQLTSATPLAFDHGSGEDVIKTTVGDRSFLGPFSLSTIATAQLPSKSYVSTTPLNIYDGEEEGSMDISSATPGPDGNTPSNTILKFVGTKPFSAALVTNGAGLTNGIPREADSDFRSRIRQQRQALSTGNIDAVTSAIFNANNNGQVVKFVQVVEDPSPTLPSIAYIDDGSGFTPTQATSTNIPIVPSALGGEKRFFIPSQYLPIVTNDVENAAYVFGNVVISKNAIPLTQGTGPGQYQINPNRGIFRLNDELAVGDVLQVDTITYYTGLIQQANYQLYGKREDRENFPGIVALGSWVTARAPAVQFVSIQGTLILDSSRSLNDVVVDIESQFLNYINNLGIGVTVVKNKLISLAFVPGVKGISLLLPVTDVIIPDGTLARTTAGNIVVS